MQFLLYVCVCACTCRWAQWKWKWSDLEWLETHLETVQYLSEKSLCTMGVLSITIRVVRIRVCVFLDYTKGMTRPYYACTIYVQETPTNRANMSKFGHKGRANCLCILPKMIYLHKAVLLFYYDFALYVISFHFGCDRLLAIATTRAFDWPWRKHRSKHWLLNWQRRRHKNLCNLWRTCALLWAYKWKRTHPHMCVWCKMYKCVTGEGMGVQMGVVR